MAELVFSAIVLFGSACISANIEKRHMDFRDQIRTWKRIEKIERGDSTWLNPNQY